MSVAAPPPRREAVRDPVRRTRSGAPGPRLDLRRDGFALVGLCVLVTAVHAVTHRGGVAVGMDVATQFIPWFDWLGEQLAAGTIPQWNPTVFAGTPSAGDPLSGWGYVPAMVLFALLDLGVAVHAFLIAQLLLVALGTYLLARAVGLPVAGAMAAAVTATFNGFVFQRNGCCVAFVSVQAWIPWLLLGIERALAATGARFVGAVAVAGFALSQAAGGWPGQGTLYVLILAGAWLVGRGMLAAGPLRDRVRNLTTTAATLGVVGIGLSAPVVWPRLQVNPATNLAGGYPGQSVTNWHGGWWPGDWTRLVEPGIWHVGAVALLLAATALIIARHERLAWLLGGIVAAALVLALPIVTPLNAPLLLLPTVDRILTHAPQRALLIAYPAVALLVGLAVARLRIPRVPHRIAVIALLVLLCGELAVANAVALRRALVAPRNPALVRRIEPETFYAASGAGRFLQRMRDRGEIGRYAAFTPFRRDDGAVVSASYFFFWHYPSVQRLEAHNESMPLGLEHVQGYNPTHLSRFDDLVTAANGRGQDYHVANLFPVAFDRGAFDLLNGRWVVVNRNVDHRDPGLVGERMAMWPVVHADRHVRVLENPDALPRAWVVHEARRVRPGEALDQLLGGAVDPRTTALLTTPPPPLASTGAGTATVTTRTTDRVTVDVDVSGDALLVLSEVFHPLWRATVDGRAAEVIPVDDVLRGVAVPTGRHTVTLTTDRTVLHGGLIVAAVTALALAGAALSAHRRRVDR